MISDSSEGHNEKNKKKRKERWKEKKWWWPVWYFLNVKLLNKVSVVWWRNLRLYLLMWTLLLFSFLISKLVLFPRVLWPILPMWISIFAFKRSLLTLWYFSRSRILFHKYSGISQALMRGLLLLWLGTFDSSLLINCSCYLLPLWGKRLWIHFIKIPLGEMTPFI